MKLNLPSLCRFFCEVRSHLVWGHAMIGCMPCWQMKAWKCLSIAGIGCFFSWFFLTGLNFFRVSSEYCPNKSLGKVGYEIWLMNPPVRKVFALWMVSSAIRYLQCTQNLPPPPPGSSFDGFPPSLKPPGWTCLWRALGNQRRDSQQFSHPAHPTFCTC